MIDYAGIAGVTAVILGGLTVLVPVVGLTARFTLRPIVEAIGGMRANQASKQQMELMERRLALLEEQQHASERLLDRLADLQNFDAQLRAESSPRQIESAIG